RTASAQQATEQAGQKRWLRTWAWFWVGDRQAALDTLRAQGKMETRHGDASRRQSLPHPLAAIQAVPQPVMQAALAPLPELPLIRLEAVAAPVRWAGRFQQNLRAVLGGGGYQHAPAGDHLALRAGPRADARIQR